MAMDPKVAAVLDSHDQARGDEDEDDLIAALEEENESEVAALANLRERRVQELHEEFAREKSKRGHGGGTYQEIREEKALMDMTTSNCWVVVHFFKADFNRCRVMDAHLENLAPKHFDTCFLRIDVENAPFLVTRLNVRVLPCVLVFRDGVSVDRIIGFEGLGHGDSFGTRDLETRLFKAGVLNRVKDVQNPASKSSQQARGESDDEWDD